jgi:hypothetical protein
MFADDWEVLLSQRYGAGNVQRVPQFSTVQDVLQTPVVLAGRTPAEVAARIGSTPGWRVETLGRVRMPAKVGYSENTGQMDYPPDA